MIGSHGIDGTVRMPASPANRASSRAAAGGTSTDVVILLTAPDAWRSIRCVMSRGAVIAAASVTVPSTGSTSASACGPTSQRPPLSRRHGEAPNGLPSS